MAFSSRYLQTCASATTATLVRRSQGGASGKGRRLSGDPKGPWEARLSQRCLGISLAHRGAAGSDSLAHPLSPLSAADSASGAGDDPGSRAGVLGQAVASALGICGSPWLRTHDRWPPFPCRGESADVRRGMKGAQGEGILIIPTRLFSPDPRGSPQHCICQC